MKWFVFILVVLIAAMQYKLWFAQDSVLDVLHLKEQVEAQVAKNKQLCERNVILEAEVKNLKSGQTALEERARTDLGMLKGGETFYQIVKPPLKKHKRR